MLLLIVLVGLANASAAALPVQEAQLNPSGEVYEINRDGRGGLLISDYVQGQIWQVAAATGEYTIFGGIDPLDARADDDGNIWWTDGSTGFGHINVASDSVTTWELSGGQNLWGITPDTAGNVWMSQFYGSEIFRFDLTSGQLCQYEVGSPSYYIREHGGQIWLGDWQHDEIVRLDSATTEVQWWKIVDGNATPQGLTIAENGDLWWADSGLRALMRLQPSDNRMTTYTIPTSGAPEMIVLSGESVWYTGHSDGTVGLLDPTVAVGASVTVSSGVRSISSSCQVLGSGSTRSITVDTGTLAWTDGAWNAVIDSDGWVVYQMPGGSHPWGIALEDAAIWITDQGRQKLARFAVDQHTVTPTPTVTPTSTLSPTATPQTHKIYLPFILSPAHTVHEPRDQTVELEQTDPTFTR